MRKPILALALCAALLTPASALVTAQAMPARSQPAAPPRLSGPVIEKFGGVYDVPDATLRPPTDRDLKLRFDVNTGVEDGALNMGFDTLARFLNMHARAGVPRERLKLALVVHGPAGRDLLDNAEYRKRYGKDNPNVALVDALKAAGVRIYLCGQTSVSRNLPRAVVNPSAEIAYSAMTAHLALQSEGYALNPF
jgi:intracellular sulfur oxidation DsrE/DsrF family protein